MQFLPYLVLLLVLFGLLFFGQARRRRQLAEEMVRLSKLGFGDEVMTTSGLYGTIVARNDDGTVQLAIAPGVEVRWALAALRAPESLPEEYRRGMPGTGGTGGTGGSGASGGTGGAAGDEPPQPGESPR